MEAELNTLDEKLNQLVQLCHRLRKDNHELRQQLAAAQNQNKQLTDKIESARRRAGETAQPNSRGRGMKTDGHGIEVTHPRSQTSHRLQAKRSRKTC